MRKVDNGRIMTYSKKSGANNGSPLLLRDNGVDYVALQSNLYDISFGILGKRSFQNEISLESLAKSVFYNNNAFVLAKRTLLHQS